MSQAPRCWCGCVPAGRSLGLGCGHGGLVALLGWVGFDAVGLETDTWVVDFARQSFGMRLLGGTLEQQDLEEISLDAGVDQRSEARPYEIGFQIPGAVFVEDGVKERQLGLACAG